MTPVFCVFFLVGFGWRLFVYRVFPAWISSRISEQRGVSGSLMFPLKKVSPNNQSLGLEPGEPHGSIWLHGRYMMDQLKASMAGPSGDHVPSSFSSFIAAQLFGLASPERTSPAQLLGLGFEDDSLFVDI